MNKNEYMGKIMSDSGSNRRQFLKQMGCLGGASLSLGLMACQPNRPASQTSVLQDEKNENTEAIPPTLAKQQQYDFYGKHQSGIITPAQRHVYFLVADLHSTDLAQIRQMFQNWTVYAGRLMRGQSIMPDEHNPHLPPNDTGEAHDLSAYGLTLTFGVSPSFFEKLGLNHKKPKEFEDLPHFPRDQIRPEYSGGDICIQACSDDPQVAFHAVRQLVRQARSFITMKWSQSAYNSFENHSDTPRNLFAFKDGTANHNTLKNPQKWLWIDDGWAKNGSYLVVRLIQMHLETWDRTSLNGQEETFGRHRHSGAFIGKQHEMDDMPVDERLPNGDLALPSHSHVGLAKRTGLEMLRRSFSYSSGIDPKTGQFNAGLLFISFQKSPHQFNVIQNAFGRNDKMTEYTTHIGSGVFLCFGGVEDENGYLGQGLF